MDLAGSQLRTEELIALVPLIEENIRIRAVDLSNNHLTDDAGKIIAAIVQGSDSIVTLKLRQNQLEESGMHYLGQALAQNTSIDVLDMSWNHIRLKGAVCLCNGIKLNKYLHTLHISSNGFGYEGAVALGELLKHNMSLRELDISNNRICWKGALAMTGGIKRNRFLKFLKMSRNPLTTTGALDILEAISSDRSVIRRLDIQGIPVVGEFELLSMAIRHKREFSCAHGGLVSSHDILGRRPPRRIEPMSKVIKYMNEHAIRPLELLRSFDKTSTWCLSLATFLSKLKKCNIPLYQFELREIGEYIQSRGTAEMKGIDYRSFVQSVSDHIKEVREEKRSDLLKTESLELYQKEVLKPQTPTYYDPQFNHSCYTEFQRAKLPLLTKSPLNLIHGSTVSLSPVPGTETGKQKGKRSLKSA